jgi:hypothetical protein
MNRALEHNYSLTGVPFKREEVIAVTAVYRNPLTSFAGTLFIVNYF